MLRDSVCNLFLLFVLVQPVDHLVTGLCFDESTEKFFVLNFQIFQTLHPLLPLGSPHSTYSIIDDLRFLLRFYFAQLLFSSPFEILDALDY